MDFAGPTKPPNRVPPVDLAVLAEVKRALAALPDAKRAEAYARALGLPEIERFAWLPLGLQRRAAAEGAAAFHEFAPGGGPGFVADPPIVIGGGNHRRLHGVPRSAWVACLLDVRVRGRSAFIEWQGRALLDAEPRERAGLDDRLDFDPAVAAVRAEEVCLPLPAAAVEIEEAFTLLGPQTGSFGTWLLHYLAKYVAANLARALPPVPVLIDAGLPPRHREALQAILPPGVEIIELPPFQMARVRRLWCAAGPAYCPIGPVAGDRLNLALLAPTPARLVPVRAEILRRLTRFEPAAANGEPLFLSGADPSVSEISAEAAARGFRVVDPQTLDFAGQIALVRGAWAIAGAGAAAMDLACFVRPGANVRLLHSADTAALAVWHCFFSDSGIDLAIVTDPAARDALLAAGRHRRDPGLSEPPAAAWRAAPEPKANALVSLLCITYNHEKFVREAVRGVLAQTYAPLDIVILDDASPDGTAAAIAAELASHPPRADVRAVGNAQNLGAFGSMRHGLSLARGKFVVTCAGDDVMLPALVERMVAVWQEARVSLVTANAAYIDEDGNSLNRFYADPDAPFDDSFETLARYGYNTACFGPVMGLELQLLEEFGYPPDYLTAEDVMLPFYAYLAKGVRFLAEPLVRYRVHPNNSSLSLQWERAEPADRLRLEAEMHCVQLAHAQEMVETLETRAAADPARYGETARRIVPMLTEQATQMARGIVNTRIALAKLGVTRLIVPVAAPPAGATQASDRAAP